MKSTLLVIPALLILPYFIFSQANKLIAHYPMDGSGDDLSYLKNNAAIFNVLPTKDRFGNDGKAFLFNGTNSYLDCGLKDLPFSDTITVTAWIKSTANKYQWIIGKYNFSSDKGFLLYTYDKKLGFDGRDANDIYTPNKKSILKVCDGNWHFVAGIITKESWTTFIDCQYQGTSNNGHNFVNVNCDDYKMSIGRFFYDNTGDFQFFDGSMDDVRIYNKGLSENELNFLTDFEPQIGIIDTTLCTPFSFKLNNENFTEPGEYVQYLKTSLGCDSILNIKISPTLNSQKRIIGDSFICKQTLAKYSVNLGPNESISWTANGVNIGSQNEVKIEINKPTKIVAIITDSKGCFVKDSLFVKPINLDDVKWDDENLEICKNSELSLPFYNPENFSLQWSVDKKIYKDTNPLILKIDTSMIISLKVTLSDICVKEFSKSITVINEEELEISGIDTIFCFGEEIESAVINGDQFDNFIWKYDDKVIGNVDKIELNAEKSGTLDITAISIHGCKKMYSKFIDVRKFQDANFTYAYDSCTYQMTIIPLENSNGKMLISNGSSEFVQSNLVFNLTEGDYIFTRIINDSSSCISKVSKEISIVNPKNLVNLVFPNVFKIGSPSNGQFCPHVLEDVKIYSFDIFDRWGNKMFSSKDADACWDGYCNGCQCQEDVYIYFLTFSRVCNSAIEKITGTVLLLK